MCQGDYTFPVEDRWEIQAESRQIKDDDRRKGKKMTEASWDVGVIYNVFFQVIKSVFEEDERDWDLADW